MLLPTRITILVVAIIIFVSLSFSVSNWITLGNSADRFDQSTKDGRSELWNQILINQTKEMINNTPILIRDRPTKKALKNKDVNQLAESAATTFNLLSASNVLSRLQITDDKGDVLFSSPNTFTGKSKKMLISKAITEGKVVSGIERDDDGVLLNIVAFPLSNRGKIIGTGVYARRLDQAVEEFKSINKSSVFITSTSGKVDYVTNDSLLKNLKSEFNAMEVDSTITLEMDDFFFSVVNIPILNAQGQITANFITAKDFTDSYEEQQLLFISSWSITAFIVLVSLFAVYLYMSYVLKPLGGVVRELDKISNGDLSLAIEIKSNDEIGSLQRGMQLTVTKLREIVSQMMEMTEQLGNTSVNIGDCAASTRKGVYQEQEQITQLTTAITQMTVTVQEVARNANEVASSAEKSGAEAASGQAVVQKTIESIQGLALEINNSNEVVTEVESDSNAIGTIIDTIKGIAEQTNLLALNAAIEAARAGEQGRGFAVVADEVRTLASKTQDSTKKIQDMIESLQSKVQKASHVMSNSQNMVVESVTLAEQSGKSLDLITNVTSTISDMIIQIATAAEQQATVSEEINRNAVNINEISVESSEGVDVIFKETELLTEVTDKLQGIANKFTV